MRKPSNILGTLDQQYCSALLLSVTLQAAVMTIASLTLDFGILYRIACYSMLPFWAMTVLILLKRPKSPSKADIAIIKFGYVAFFLLLYAIHTTRGG